ncbi:MAG: ribosomal subunit interface protein, partial [bacterium (Candidatus Ratteibacteria) CG15_BIG_FIL_POST_REV_8_21_14_020_41_12]
FRVFAVIFVIYCMEFRIRYAGMELTPSISDYVEKKLQREEKYLAPSSTAEINLSVEGYRQTAEIIIHSGRKTIVAEETSEKIYHSIDQVLDKLEKQLSRRKKRRDKKR